MGLIYIIPLAWWLANFEPLQATLTRIYMSIPPSTLGVYVFDAFTCIKCISFWLTLFLTFDFLYACQVALLAYILELVLNRLT